MRTPIDASYLADTVVMLRMFEHAGRVKKAISVLKKRSGRHEETIRQMWFDGSGVHLGEPLMHLRGVLTGVPVEIDRAARADELQLPHGRCPLTPDASRRTRADRRADPARRRGHARAAGARVREERGVPRRARAGRAARRRGRRAAADRPHAGRSAHRCAAGRAQPAARVVRRAGAGADRRARPVAAGGACAGRADQRDRARSADVDAGHGERGAGGAAGAAAAVPDPRPDRSSGCKAEQALRDADRRKDEFLATLAHELRNPLAPIRTGLQVLDRVARRRAAGGARARDDGAPAQAAGQADRRPARRVAHRHRQGDAAARAARPAQR